MFAHVLRSAKAYAALIGAVATALLSVYGPDTEVGHWLTVAVAVCTAVGTYAVPNLDVIEDYTAPDEVTH